jgi:hypothetical protein
MRGSPCCRKKGDERAIRVALAANTVATAPGDPPGFRVEAPASGQWGLAGTFAGATLRCGTLVKRWSLRQQWQGGTEWESRQGPVILR